MSAERKFPVKLPGPINDIVDILGHPSDGLSVAKKATRVAAAKMKDANQDFTEADQIVRSMKIRRRK